MRYIKNLGIMAHTFVLILIGVTLILLSLNLFSSQDIASVIDSMYADANIKMSVGIVGAIFVLAGLLMAHLNLGRMQMEKTIAFENPEGQVTVSLSAIEDFIKKSVHHLPEVKELKSSVTASKKGINIVCRATIYADSNIPEITERIQNIVKAKVHDMLGVEETINIKINVIKISLSGKGEPKKSGKGYNEESSRRIPFGAGE